MFSGTPAKPEAVEKLKEVMATIKLSHRISCFLREMVIYKKNIHDTSTHISQLFITFFHPRNVALKKTRNRIEYVLHYIATDPKPQQ